PKMGTDVLLQWVEAAGQPVSSTALFLQDSLAIMVIEGLLNQIKLMKRQRVSALEQIECTEKRKLPLPEDLSSEPKQARLQPPQPAEAAKAEVPSAICLVLAVGPSSLSVLAQPTAMSTGQPAVLKVPAVLVKEVWLEQ
ncbi:hypothetical protein C0992_013105, partial [Termitomyces sp. T32_za158]